MKLEAKGKTEFVPEESKMIKVNLGKLLSAIFRIGRSGIRSDSKKTGLVEMLLKRLICSVSDSALSSTCSSSACNSCDNGSCSKCNVWAVSLAANFVKLLLDKERRLSISPNILHFLIVSARGIRYVKRSFSR